MIRGIAVAQATIHLAIPAENGGRCCTLDFGLQWSPLKQMGRLKWALWQDLSGRSVKKGLENNEKGKG